MGRAIVHSLHADVTPAKPISRLFGTSAPGRFPARTESRCPCGRDGRGSIVLLIAAIGAARARGDKMRSKRWRCGGLVAVLVTGGALLAGCGGGGGDSTIAARAGRIRRRGARDLRTRRQADRGGGGRHIGAGGPTRRNLERFAAAAVVPDTERIIDGIERPDAAGAPGGTGPRNERRGESENERLKAEPGVLAGQGPVRKGQQARRAGGPRGLRRRMTWPAPTKGRHSTGEPTPTSAPLRSPGSSSRSWSWRRSWSPVTRSTRAPRSPRPTATGASTRRPRSSRRCSCTRRR